ncbi:MAG: hypothetical protein WBC92_11625 [Terracidiphilus sp.]
MHRITRAAAVIAAGFILGVAAVPAAAALSTSDACTLLSTAQITSAIGISVGTGVWTAPTFKTTCSWNAAGSGWITLMITNPDAFQSARLPSKGSIVDTTVSSLGDDAYYLAVGENIGLFVKKGTFVFKIAIYGQESLDQKRAMEKTLARQILSEL